MGPLIFMARRHQIKRKKSTYQYRLLQVSNQRQQIAEQMGQANKAKALRQSLFTTANQQAQNQLMRALMLPQMFAQQAQNQKFIDMMSGCQAKWNKNNIMDENGKLKQAFTINGTPYAAGTQLDSTQQSALGAALMQEQMSDMQKMAQNQFYNNGSGFGGLTMMMMQSIAGANSMGNQIMQMAMDEHDEAELARLHVIDSQLEQEQVSLENQLKLLEAEEQAVEKQMDEEIKKSAPKFGLNG